MANDFDGVLDSVLPQLSGTDRSKRAAASAAVAMLLTQAPEGTHLSTRVLPAVSPLLSDDDCLVQVFAAADACCGVSGNCFSSSDSLPHID